MQLVSLRIITADLNRLVNFYELVTGISATRFTEDFAELNGKSATLAIGSIKTLALFGGEHVAEAGRNRSVIIEFIVDDVDARYTALKDLDGIAVIQPPVTMPWGNRSLLLRDPDGNLVNFFTPVSRDARKKFGLETGAE